MSGPTEEQVQQALQRFEDALARAWALGLAAYDDLLPEAPQRAGNVWSVMWRLRRAVTTVLPDASGEHAPARGLGVHGAVTRGYELDWYPELGPFCTAAIEVEQLWQDGLGLATDGVWSRPPGWERLVAELAVPELPPAPPGLTDPDAAARAPVVEPRRSWWRRGGR